MTCEEFQRVLPESWGDHTAEQDEHLQSCSACAELVSDLNAISGAARFLQASEDPSSRVWNSIELQLKREGLIHEPRPLRPWVAAFPRLRAAWLVPLMAGFVMTFAVLLFERGTGRPQTAEQAQPTPAVAAVLQSERGKSVLAEDQQLLKLVAVRAPALRAAYESDLRAVDAYIRDAELTARRNPNDEIAQQYLMNAYEQRAMVYHMALDRSLP